MELLFAIGLTVVILVAFDVVALRFGVDSRPRVDDDHRLGSFTPRWV